MKLPKQEYSAEFKEQAVAQVTGGRNVSALIRELSMSEQMLCKRASAFKAGRLVGSNKWSCLICTPGIRGSSVKSNS